MPNRSSGADLRRRVELAAKLLADGMPRTAAVTQLAERFGVDRRTARRYVADGAAVLAEEIGQPDLQAAMAETVERLRRLAFLAEREGNINAAVGAEKAAASALVSLYRADVLAASRLSGHTFATVEPEPTERERRRYRQSITNPPTPF